MGGIWWIYGGLKGADPAWVQVPGRTVIQDAGDLYQAGVLETVLLDGRLCQPTSMKWYSTVS